MHLTVAYITFRREPMIDWFWRSIERELMGNLSDVSIVVVDYYASERAVSSLPEWVYSAPMVPVKPGEKPNAFITIIPPKPCVWNGPYRLTKKEYFAAASARNTALCYAPDGFVAFCDDLSVLTPGWLKAVKEAMAGDYIACGAYRKVLNLEMLSNGEVTFENYPQGWDHRWATGSNKPVPCYPNWHYGCSIAGPVSAYLKINGFPEECDSLGLGMEDQHAGIALANTGHKLMYDRRMLTLESEERHHNQTKMLRLDKKPGGVVEIQPGVTHPNEKGHHLVHRLRGATRFENDFTPFPDLAALRQHVLNGGAFPIMKTPDKDWFDQQPLSEL